MTKSDLVSVLNEKLSHLPYREVEIILDTIFDKMIEALSQGKRIEIRGFGTFEMRKRPSREGRNPKTGQKVSVSTRVVPFFKVGKELKERINREDVLAASTVIPTQDYSSSYLSS